MIDRLSVGAGPRLPSRSVPPSVTPARVALTASHVRPPVVAVTSATARSVIVAVKPDSLAVPAPEPKKTEPLVRPTFVSVAGTAAPPTVTFVAERSKVMSPVIRTASKRMISSMPAPPVTEPVTRPKVAILNVSFAVPPVRFSTSLKVIVRAPAASVPALMPLKLQTESAFGPCSVSVPPTPLKVIETATARIVASMTSVSAPALPLMTIEVRPAIARVSVVVPSLTMTLVASALSVTVRGSASASVTVQTPVLKATPKIEKCGSAAVIVPAPAS